MAAIVVTTLLTTRLAPGSAPTADIYRRDTSINNETALHSHDWDLSGAREGEADACCCPPKGFGRSADYRRSGAWTGPAPGPVARLRDLRVGSPFHGPPGGGRLRRQRDVNV